MLICWFVGIVRIVGFVETVGWEDFLTFSRFLWKSCVNLMVCAEQIGKLWEFMNIYCGMILVISIIYGELKLITILWI